MLAPYNVCIAYMVSLDPTIPNSSTQGSSRNIDAYKLDTRICLHHNTRIIRLIVKEKSQNKNRHQ